LDQNDMSRFLEEDIGQLSSCSLVILTPIYINNGH